MYRPKKYTDAMNQLLRAYEYRGANEYNEISFLISCSIELPNEIPKKVNKNRFLKCEDMLDDRELMGIFLEGLNGDLRRSACILSVHIG